VPPNTFVDVVLVFKALTGPKTPMGKIVEPEDTGGAAEMGGLLLVCGILEKTCKMRDSIATL